MRYEFYYYETCGGLVKLTAEDSQKVKNYMDEYECSFTRAYWDLVNQGEVDTPWDITDMDFVESEIESVEEIDDGE